MERRGAEVVALDAHGGVVARANVEGARTGPGAFFEGDSVPRLDVAPVDVPLAPTVAGGRRAGVRLIGVDDVLTSMDLDGPGQHRAGAGGGVAAVVMLDGASPSTAAGAAAAPRAASEPTAQDRAPGLFLDSADAGVVAFARKHGAGRAPLVDAASVADAVHDLVDPNEKQRPPSARGMLAHGGDCDGAAALVVASLRALGHAARPVVGYELKGDALVPHAWAEVLVDGTWLMVDATLPKVGADAEHLKLFDGLGGALTMGRVLGRVRAEPVFVTESAP